MRQSGNHHDHARSLSDGLRARDYLKSKSGLLIPEKKELLGMNGGFQSFDGMGQFVAITGGGLQDIIPSACGYLDATNSASYSGSGQTWANLIAAPACGSSQASYDFYRGSGSGSSGNDPTFNGTPGTPSCYWSFDGSQFFTNTQTNTTQGLVLRSLQRSDSGNAWWICQAIRTVSGGTLNRLFGTRDTNTSIGVSFLCASSTINMTQSNGSLNSNTIAPTGTLGDNTNVLIIVSYDATTNQYRYWKNARTATATGTWTNWRTSAGTNATYTTKIDADGSGSTPSGAGVRTYSFACGNAYIGNTEAALLADFFNAQHGRTYA